MTTLLEIEQSDANVRDPIVFAELNTVASYNGGYRVRVPGMEIHGGYRVEMSARTGSSQMPAPVPVPAGTGQPNRRGCKYGPGQAGPSRYTGTGIRHVP